MAKTCRIDGPPVVNSDGSVEIACTTGIPPLNAAPSGVSFSWPSMAALQQSLAELEGRIGDRDLVLMALAQHTKTYNDSDLSLAKKTVAQGGFFPGRVVEIDFAVGGAKVIVYKP